MDYGLHLVEAEFDVGLHIELRLQLVEVLLPGAVVRQLYNLSGGVHRVAGLQRLHHVFATGKPHLGGAEGVKGGPLGTLRAGQLDPGSKRGAHRGSTSI
eukprot:2374233-Pyramimonas_sp.AAC.1